MVRNELTKATDGQTDVKHDQAEWHCQWIKFFCGLFFFKLDLRLGGKETSQLDPLTVAFS